MNWLMKPGASLVVASVVAGLGCRDTKGDQLRYNATVQLVEMYKYAAEEASSHCGKARMLGADYPSVFFHSPGWVEWKGPYLRGKPATNDHYGLPLHFVPKEGALEIRSAGVDKQFGTKDDIVRWASLE